MAKTQSPTQPAAPAGDANYAGFFIRFLAALVDMIIVGIVMGILGSLFGLAGGATSGSGTFSVSSPTQSISWLLSIAYYVYFIGSRGQTLGKMALKIKVVRVDNRQPPGYVHAFLREVVGKFISAIILLLGYFWMLWDNKKQTWHDKIASTIVVKV